MKCEKPQLSNSQEKANELYLYLKQRFDYVSKEEIGAYLGVKNERSVRDIISLLATKKPILSNSGGKGYKLAQTIDDLEELKHTWAELDSRIEQLEERKKPLLKFYEKIIKINAQNC